MGTPYRPLLVVVVGALSCSSSSAKNAAHDTGRDAAVMDDAAAPAKDAAAAEGAADADVDAPEDVRVDVLPRGLFGAATFYELALPKAKLLSLSLSFHEAFFHDYDDTQSGIGCTADHFDATKRPLPHDADAGLVRVSGFLGGTTLAGSDGSNPIGCMPGTTYYGCSYPDGSGALQAAFASSAMPFGPAAISFAGNGGNDFGAFFISGPTKMGTLTVSEDLTALRYDPTKDTVLHPACTDSCPGARVAVELTAFASSQAAVGWPYPSVGVVRCIFESAPAVTVPHAALAAALTYDLSLDAIETAVILLPSAKVQTHDFFGNQFAAEVGRGVAGFSAL
jgi:hypothetical protein